MAGLSDTPLDERLAQLVKQTPEGDNQLSRPEGDNQLSRPKIQRVPAFWRQNPDFAKYYSPKMISFGPIHHGNEDLKLGQQFKMQWTSLYIEEYGKQTNKSPKEAAQFLHKIVEGDIGELKKLFAEDVIESYSDDKLTWMLFVDGCSLLYYMDNVDTERPEALKLKLDQLMYTWRDIILLENQLPMRLLELLSKRKGSDLAYLMHNFQTKGYTKRSRLTIISLQDRPQPTHILDSYRSVYTNTDGDDDIQNGNNVRIQQDIDEEYVWQTYKSIRILKKQGFG